MKLSRQAVFLVLLPGLLGAGVAQAQPEPPAVRAKNPPKEPQALLELGRELRRAGAFDDAVRVLRRGYPRAAQGDLGIALRWEAARSYVDAGKQQLAVRECASLRKLDAARADVCTAEAHLLWKRASLALPLVEGALAKRPGDYDALVAKGRTLAQMGQPAAAEGAFRKAITSDSKRHDAHYRLGELLAAQGKTKQSVAALQQAVQLAPQEPVPWLTLGTTLPPGATAQRALEKALALRPSFGEALARLGEVRFELGDRSGAVTALEKAIGIDDKQADWHASLGRVRVALGDHKAALESSARALRLVKNHGPAKLVEADALASRGDIDLAIESYEHALAFARTDPKPLVHGARACLKHNRPTTARAFADRATSDFPAHAPAWEILGDVAVKTREVAVAKKAYQTALKARDGRIDRASVQKKLGALR